MQLPTICRTRGREPAAFPESLVEMVHASTYPVLSFLINDVDSRRAFCKEYSAARNHGPSSILGLELKLVENNCPVQPMRTAFHKSRVTAPPQ